MSRSHVAVAVIFAFLAGIGCGVLGTQPDLAVEKDLAPADLDIDTLNTWYLRSQALIAMMIRDPAVGRLLASEEFKQKFRSEWYDPEGALEAIGEEWFAEEVAGCGIEGEY